MVKSKFPLSVYGDLSELFIHTQGRLNSLDSLRT